MNLVLVLNASYEPLNITTIKRAIVLVLKDKAEPIEVIIERRFKSENISLPYPLVIRLVKYVKIPNRIKLRISRKAVLARDSYVCQYCGKEDYSLTVDHVVPKSRGGTTSWENVVAACPYCNNRKSNKLLYEVNMSLIRPPAEPSYLVFILLGTRVINEAWRPYLATIH